MAKAGSIGIIGVYPPTVTTWPMGAAMQQNLTLEMGNCPHRAIIPRQVDMVASGVSDPARARLSEGGARAGGVTPTGPRC